QYTSVKSGQNSRNSRNDENSVDVEVEMAELAKNSIYYNVMSKRAAGHFSSLNQVIQQGGK
ncbi:MAG: flagellar basal body rod protein FlgB, partial [Halanaerobium sp.]